MSETTYTVIKYVVSIAGAGIAIIQPTIPYGLICTALVFYDCFSAFQLCKRLKKNHPESNVEPFFTSDGMRRAFETILRIYVIIVLAYLVDAYILDFLSLHLAQFVSAGFCLMELWSILENESSESDATWAKVLQKFLVDKGKKYLDIDIENGNTTQTNTTANQ